MEHDEIEGSVELFKESLVDGDAVRIANGARDKGIRPHKLLEALLAELEEKVARAAPEVENEGSSGHPPLEPGQPRGIFPTAARESREQGNSAKNELRPQTPHAGFGPSNRCRKCLCKGVVVGRVVAREIRRNALQLKRATPSALEIFENISGPEHPLPGDVCHVALGVEADLATIALEHLPA
jgi:hypothetical protein